MFYTLAIVMGMFEGEGFYDTEWPQVWLAYSPYWTR